MGRGSPRIWWQSKWTFLNPKCSSGELGSSPNTAPSQILPAFAGSPSICPSIWRKVLPVIKISFRLVYSIHRANSWFFLDSGDFMITRCIIMRVTPAFLLISDDHYWTSLQFIHPFFTANISSGINRLLWRTKHVWTHWIYHNKYMLYNFAEACKSSIFIFGVCFCHFSKKYGCVRFHTNFKSANLPLVGLVIFVKSLFIPRSLLFYNWPVKYIFKERVRV